MNNRFKFRVYDPTLKKLILFSLDNIIVSDNLLCQDKYPVQQYTGLNDSLNNEIYEGDIIEMTYDHIIERGFVVWENNSYILKTIGEDSYAPLVIFLITKDKVIGNIYENPELLKKHENQKQKSQEQILS